MKKPGKSIEQIWATKGSSLSNKRLHQRKNVGNYFNFYKNQIASFTVLNYNVLLYIPWIKIRIIFAGKNVDGFAFVKAVISWSWTYLFGTRVFFPHTIIIIIIIGRFSISVKRSCYVFFFLSVRNLKTNLSSSISTSASCRLSTVIARVLTISTLIILLIIFYYYHYYYKLNS